LRHCTDSPDTSLAKPPTPPPTVVSRRCFTPDRPSRARLVLDLRRSRSHDKLDSASTVVNSHHDTPVKSIPSKISLSVTPSLNAPPPLAVGNVGETGGGLPAEEPAISKRRGKKLKRKKAGRSSDKGFQGLSEPEKTQVSTLEVAEDREGPPGEGDGDAGQRLPTTPQSFLDNDSLQYLHRGLTSASIRCEVNRKVKSGSLMGLLLVSDMRSCTRSKPAKLFARTPTDQSIGNIDAAMCCVLPMMTSSGGGCNESGREFSSKIIPFLLTSFRAHFSYVFGPRNG